MFPASYDRYIEVFGGGGWVLFGKPPDDRCMEIYNDYNSNLANLFYCVKNRTGAFLKELGFLPLNSRDEFTVIRNFIEKQEPDTRFLIEELELAEKHLMPPDYEEVKKILLENAEVTDVKRAAAFFKLIRYSYGSGCTSFGCRPFDVRNCFDTIWQASRRLADTVIENKDFEALIRQYDRDSAFFYCDPPYYETEGHYAVVFRKEDHKRLRDTLTGSSGWSATMTAISSGNCMQDILLQLLPASITWPRGMRAVVSFQRSLLPIMILVRGSGQNQDSWIYLECGEMEKRIIMRSGKKSVRKERCYENRKQEKNNGAKKGKRCPFCA